MKFSSTILALAFIQSANAFVVQPATTSIVQGKTSSVQLSAMMGEQPGSFGRSPNMMGAGQSGSFGRSPSNFNVDQDIAFPNAQGVSGGLKPKFSSKSKQMDRDSRSSRDDPKAATIQGGSLKTWSFSDPIIERVQVKLTTNGRPLNADVDLWQGPNNTPQKIAVYIEDGALRPFNAMVETPRGQNTVAVLNTASMEYPIEASVKVGGRGEKLSEIPSDGITIQGGAIKTFSFGSPVGSVQLLLKTEGRPLNARIELLQGPNNNKQVIDLYTEDGYDRPFYAVVETPGSGNVLRIVNTSSMEYPLTCSVEPYSVEPGFDERATSDAQWDKVNDASFFFLSGQ